MTRTTRLAASLILGLTATCLSLKQADAQGNGLGLVSDPTGRVLMNESIITESTGSGTRRVPFGPRYRGYAEYGDGFGWNTEGQNYANVFYPIHITPFVDLIFVDARGYVAYNSEGNRARAGDKYGANVGVGYRRYFDQINTIIGASVWYDVDGAQTDTWQRYGASIEAIVNGFEMRLNGYLNDGDGTKNVTSFFTDGVPRFQNNFIIINQRNLRNVSFEGVEFEVGGPVPYAQNIGLNAYVGGYWLNNDEEDISRGGAMARAEVYLHEDVQIGGQVRRDDIFGTSLWATLAVQVPNEPFRVWWRRFLQPRGPQQHLSRQVERLYRVPVRQIVEDVQVPLLDPKDGQPIFVVHVDPNGAGGDGTFERPHNSASFSNDPRSDIIRVLPGNFAPAGGVVLHDCQRLLGANQAHFFTSTDGTFTLPGQVAGSNPVITNPGGGNVVTLANNTEVSAVDIDGGGTGNGIIGANITDFSLNRLNIANAVNGIQLTNIAQSGLAVPFGRNNVIEDVNVTGSTVTGIRFLQDNGGAGVVAINRVNSNGNGFDGLLFDLRNNSTFNATIANASLNSNSRNGLRVILASGAIATIDASDVSVTNAGQHGVFFDVRSATLNPSTLTRFSVMNSGQGLVAGLRDGYNLNVISGSTATLSIADSIGVNTGGGVTQQNGLMTRVESGSSLVATLSNVDLSGNSVSALNVLVRDAGTVHTLTGTGINGNNSGVDGFLFDVAAGSFTSMITNSSFDNSGRNAIRALGGASPAVVNVTLDSTSANNSVGDGVFMLIAGGGGPSTFNFNYLPTSPSAILNSMSGTGVMATFTGAGTTGLVNFNGITIDGAFTAVTAGTTVTVTP